MMVVNEVEVINTPCNGKKNGRGIENGSIINKGLEVRPDSVGVPF